MPEFYVTDKPDFTEKYDQNKDGRLDLVRQRFSTILYTTNEDRTNFKTNAN